MEKEICNNLVLYPVLFRFGHIRRWDQCAVYILYSKISTDPGLLKIRHSHRFVAVVIQILIPLIVTFHMYQPTSFLITKPNACKPFTKAIGVNNRIKSWKIVFY